MPYVTFGSVGYLHKPNITLDKYLAVIFGLFYFVTVIFGPKIAKNSQNKRSNEKRLTKNCDTTVLSSYLFSTHDLRLLYHL